MKKIVLGNRWLAAWFVGCAFTFAAASANAGIEYHGILNPLADDLDQYNTVTGADPMTQGNFTIPYTVQGDNTNLVVVGLYMDATGANATEMSFNGVAATNIISTVRSTLAYFYTSPTQGAMIDITGDTPLTTAAAQLNGYIWEFSGANTATAVTSAMGGSTTATDTIGTTITTNGNNRVVASFIGANKQGDAIRPADDSIVPQDNFNHLWFGGGDGGNAAGGVGIASDAGVNTLGWTNTAGGGNSNWGELAFAFNVPDAIIETVRLIVDRETGQMTFTRVGSTITNVAGYSITSAGGALNPAAWMSVSDNYDDAGPVGGGQWTELSQAGSKTDFSEFTFDTDTAPNGGQFSNGSIQLGGDDAWTASPIEDLQMVVKLTSGVDMNIVVEYTGDAVLRSDFDNDGDIDADDYQRILDSYGTTLSTTLTDVEQYQLGDLSGNGIVNATDFRTFKEDYLAFIAGSGASVNEGNSQVPEPTTLALLGMALSGIGILPRRRRRAAIMEMSAAPRRVRRLTVASVVATLAVVAQFALSSSAQAEVIHRYQFNGAVGAAPESTVIADTGTGGTYGVADGVIVGTGATFDGNGGLRLNGGTQFGGAAYVDLENNGMISSIDTDASFEMWYTVNVQSSWARVFSFGSTGVNMETTDATTAFTDNPSDYLNFLPAVNVNYSNQQFALQNNDADNPVGQTGTTGNSTANGNVNTSTTGRIIHMVGTIVKDRLNDDSNFPQYQLFINGVPGGIVEGASERGLPDINDLNNWLGRSPFPGDGRFNGTFHEFRIYDEILDYDQISRNALFGPELALDAVTGELTLEVTSTGAMTIKNNYNMALPAFDQYTITSAGNRLNPGGWQTFDSTEGGDATGVGWDQVTNPTSGELAEFWLSEPGDTSFAAGTSRSLGNAWLPGGAEDLVFTLTTPTGVSVNANVVYVPGADLLGDYNQDGTVNAADYTVYRNRKAGIGGTTLPNDAGDDGVTIDDYNYWKAHYGETAGSGASTENGGNVPEPTTLLSLVMGSLLLVGFNRRRARA